MTYDQFMLALCLWRESRSHPEAYSAIKHVILNRAARRKLPVHRVILQPWQFSSFNALDANSSKFPQDNQGADWRAWLQAVNCVTSDTEDPTSGADHYHDQSIEPPVRAWLGAGRRREELTARQTARIGPFTFYRLS
jgi:hypothetical protein